MHYLILKIMFIILGFIYPFSIYYFNAPLSTLVGVLFIGAGFFFWEVRGILAAFGWSITTGLFIYIFTPLGLMLVGGDSLVLLVVVTIIIFFHHQVIGNLEYFSGLYPEGEKHRQLKRIVNRSPAVALIWDAEEDWKLEFASENIKQFGYIPEDFTSGRIPFSQIIHPDDVDYIKKKLDQFEREQRENTVISYRILTSEGETRWVNDYSWNEYDSSGRCIRYEGIILDITRRLEAEKELTEERERLRITLHSIGDGVIATDEQGRVTLINEVAESLTGWTEKDAFGLPLDKIFPLINEQTGKPVADPVEKVLKTGKACGLANHTALVSRDGKEISIEDSAAPIRTEDGEITGVVLVFRDISDLKEAEREKTMLLERMSRSLDESRALQRITSVLLEQISLDDVLEIVCREAVRITDALNSSIYLLENNEHNGKAEKEQLELVCTAGNGQKEDDELSFEESLFDRALNAEEPIVIRVSDEHSSAGSINDTYEGLIVAPLLAGERRLGVLVVTSGNDIGFENTDLRIMKLMASHAAVAIEKANLYQEIQGLAVLKERQRLARDLHDSVSQTLFSVSLISDALPKIWKQDREEGMDRLEEIKNLSRGALAEMRTLLLELRPDGLTEVSLKELLTHLLDALQSKSRFDSVNINIEETFHLPPAVQVAFYRVAQESLNNAVKHSDAANIEINARITENDGMMKINDNGSGFNPGKFKSEGLGLKIMGERANEVGADIKIVSQPDEGTEVSLYWRGDN